MGFGFQSTIGSHFSITRDFAVLVVPKHLGGQRYNLSKCYEKPRKQSVRVFLLQWHSLLVLPAAVIMASWVFDWRGES